MNRYVCIHGHFYQPPRENPWLEAVERQDSAFPYHDWNERVSVECYRPNGEARIEQEGWVIDVVNNYSRMNFNFGPTLLSWMEEKDGATYRGILEGDRRSLERFDGHGNAIAQVYNHMILPLANTRDRVTQVRWGLADFRRRFKREPEAMWLPETAVDLASLEILVDHGMKYVILAPRQAKAIRHDGETNWRKVENENFEKKIPYWVRLPSGRQIAAFFYDGGISKGIAFEGLLHSGDDLVGRLDSAFDPNREEAQLVHVATDGETYGHHHWHGEMALAYATQIFEKSQDVKLMNYGRFLELSPPRAEARIHENSSWSCVHGIERWRSNCGCATRGDWHQRWREPFRNALDFLRDRITPEYERRASELARDPWQARDKYIDVIHDRSDESLKRYFSGVLKKEPDGGERVRFLKLMELQRHLLLMYTSCGWFFDDISGVEAVQNLQYAYRAVELAKETLSLDLEEEFASILARAPSNLPSPSNGREVLDRYVKPAKVTFLRVAAQSAMTSVFEENGGSKKVYGFEVRADDFERVTSGPATLVVGRGVIESKVTRDSEVVAFSAVHLGDQNMNAGVRAGRDTEEYESLKKKLKESFTRGDFQETLRAFDREFGEHHYSLKDLFRNEQLQITKRVLKSTIDPVYQALYGIYEKAAPLLSYLSSIQIPIPDAYMRVAELVLNREVVDALETEPPDFEQLRKALEEEKQWGLRFDEKVIELKLLRAFERGMSHLRAQGNTKAGLDELLALVDIAHALPFKPDLELVQNQIFTWHRDHSKLPKEISGPLGQLGEKLKLRWK